MRAEFYLITKPPYIEKPLLLVCELARKAHDNDQTLLILANSMTQAEVLDDLLWEFDPDAYIPHQIAGHGEDDDSTSVLIVAPETDVRMRTLVLNLRNAPVIGQFDHVLEVVPFDASAREPLRVRWKHYQSLGFELDKIDM